MASFLSDRIKAEDDMQKGVYYQFCENLIKLSFECPAALAVAAIFSLRQCDVFKKQL